MSKKNEVKNIEKDVWTDECEELLAEWSEKASCYRWLHGRSEKSYQKWYYCFSIPVIILSTLTGAANVGMDSFVPQESKKVRTTKYSFPPSESKEIFYHNNLGNLIKMEKYYNGKLIESKSFTYELDLNQNWIKSESELTRKERIIEYY